MGLRSIRNPQSKIQNQLARRREQLERKRAALERALAGAEARDELRAAGEAILASAANLAPGQATLVWEGRSIPLEPTLSPVENAQRYFEQYRKARDAHQQVPELLGQVARELAYLDEMAAFLALAADPAQVRALKAELAEAGVLGSAGGGGQASPAGGRARKPRPNRPAARALRVTTAEGFGILVGTSARCNAEVTFDLADPDDMWLHARGVPGAHVIVRSQGRPVPPAVLQRAAELAAKHSAAAGAGKVAVDWTERRHVRKQHGGLPGQVTYAHQQTLVVSL
ncbi:MAG: DUF814 domain-containing protein [Chloroflexi bacterium]|nr:DUF814 domain-containing protein [Chloroflexota bacterium]